MQKPTFQTQWIDEVIDFWFHQLAPEYWFERNDAIDAGIKSKFGALHAKLTPQVPTEATTTARGILAAVITLDQFSRNIYRDSPKAFATDEKALGLSKQALGNGYDKELSVIERHFLYMPFQHSEDRATQSQSVEIFTRLGHAVALNHAREHKAIIDRFGRFPHRNRVLGRTSTVEEEKFLRTRNVSA